MSLEKTEKIISDFLMSSDIGVLALKGEWGGGKTFFWNSLLNRLIHTSTFPYENYSYVSLFGVQNIESFKFTIFENTIDVKFVGEKFSLDNLKHVGGSGLKKASKSITWITERVPYLKNFSGGVVQALSFLSVHKTLICIDDFERKGAGLHTNDVLGLVSMLREQRECKIVLIFNHDKLAEDNDYLEYREKVIDTEVEFAPSADDAANLAFDPHWEYRDELCGYTVRLQIRNIRVLKKIERTAKLVLPLLSTMAKEVSAQALHTIALLGWSYYSKNDAPNFDYIKALSNSYLGFDEEKTKDEIQSRWDALLAAYGLTTIDGFDMALAYVVEKGYVDDEELLTAAKELNERITIAKSGNSVSESWGLFHNTFDNNETEFVESIIKSVTLNARYVDVNRLNSAVKILKELGHVKDANNLVAHYVTENNDRKGHFDLERAQWIVRDFDSEVVKAFNFQNKLHEEKKSLLDAAQSMGASKESWSSLDEHVLSAASTEDFYQLFKSFKGENLRAIVRGCLIFRKISNISESQKKIVEQVESALIRIASENKLNSLRVASYGVNVLSKNDGTGTK